MQMDANSQKAMHFISLIKQCQELALTARDAREFLRRRSQITWEHSQEDLSEWSEGKWDVLYRVANYYERGFSI